MSNAFYWTIETLIIPIFIVGDLFDWPIPWYGRPVGPSSKGR